METKAEVIFGGWNTGLGIISKELSLRGDEVTQETRLEKEREGGERAAGKETSARQPPVSDLPVGTPSPTLFNPTNKNQPLGSQPPSQSLAL